MSEPARLLVHVEGQTEEAFVNGILCPYLLTRGYAAVSARIVGNARSRARRGGIRRWDAVRNDIVRHLTEDRSCIATTMVDYYALPATGPGAWPGRADAAKLKATSGEQADLVESALLHDIARKMGPSFDRRRLEPFVVMHEYEALLFSDCQVLAESCDAPELASQLAAIRADFDTPEDINDSSETAPSKRIQSLVQRYEKPFHGELALEMITLEKVRTECPHFDRWLRRLEERATPIP